MFEALAIVAGVIVAAIAVVLILAARKPNVFRLQRVATVRAPPETIFALLSDFHRWRAWSPWENRDPAMQRTYSGAASGVGAVYAWQGNKKVGKGRMEILEASSPSKVVVQLDFLAPFEAHNVTEFTMVPQGDATRVTWRMEGPASLMSKVMQVFFNMDKMVGQDFEAGLTNLKQATEK